MLLVIITLVIAHRTVAGVPRRWRSHIWRFRTLGVHRPEWEGALGTPTYGGRGSSFWKVFTDGFVGTFLGITNGHNIRQWTPGGTPRVDTPANTSAGTWKINQDLLKGGPDFVDAQKVHSFIDEINNKSVIVKQVLVKVSKFQKQIFLFSFEPKTEWNYFLFLP